MKPLKKFFIPISLTFILFALSTSCKEDTNEITNDAAAPSIEITNGELSGLPGESVKMTAKITDDSGIKNIKIESTDWEFVNEIPFSSQNFMKSYDLNQTITIPVTASRGSSAEILISVTDQSDKITKKTVIINVIAEPAKLEIKQEMGVSVVLDGKTAQVNNNEVSFVSVPNLKWNTQFSLKSNKTKLITFKVECTDLQINETIDLTKLPSKDNGMTVEYAKEYAINGNADKYDFIFTLTDEKGKSTTYSPVISIKSTFSNINKKHSKMFILDTDIDLSKVVYGIPMLGETKSADSYKFTVRYYAEKANTKIIFVPSRESNALKYGISSDKKYIFTSANPNPIILPKVGYYEISLDLLLGTWEMQSISNDAPTHPYTTEMYLAGSGAGLGYDGNHPMTLVDGTHLFRTTFNFQNGGGQVGFGIGGGVWLVASGGKEGDEDPEVWGTKAELTGQHIFDTSINNKWGNMEITFDQFLYKSYAISK